ncbi:hypothetical protein [Clostridium sp.]|uniref:hypothetical protein n=1 Tax=Clostridium sp. TaxID=1506 RepID=UPI0026035F52|nr:hypothetical protein [Clostridium sp.]
MELFDLSPDQLNALSILISKEYSTRYNELQLSVLSDFFTALGANIDVYAASFAYFQSLNRSEE